MSSIKQIKSFVMVSDLKSFTNAAEALFMTQPAVSSQIKALEEILGLSLIERNDKRVELTEAGKCFYREAKEILAAYQRATEVMDDFKGLKRGRLSLGASTIPGEYLLPKYIGRFKKKYPGIEVSLRIGDTGFVLDLVTDRKIDLGVVGAQIEQKNVDYIPFIQDELVLIASDRREIPRNISPADLLSLEIVTREVNSGTRMAVKEALIRHHIHEDDINIVMELGSTQAVITAVVADIGVAFVSKWAAQTLIETGSIKKINVEGLDLKRDLYVVVPKNSQVTRARDIFMRYLTAFARKM
ncbi:MAG: selenium metabolism-associated LysR family transcriptional regulator [Bacillota bacterium]|jgi:DNA-binding transcriptional LysR family regulator